LRRTPREDCLSSSARDGRGAGEFAGRRRYRPGDDLRSFDWEALARGAGSLVRLRQADSGERWAVLLDTSASMAVGEPPKLQLAAELALAVCALGLELGGEVILATGAGVLELRGRAQLAQAFAHASELRAGGVADLPRAIQHPAIARAPRWFVIGDLLDVEPADLGPLARRPRRLDAVAVLAPRELAPLLGLPLGSRIEWRDPESAARHQARLGVQELAAYERELSAQLERWRARARLLVARAGEAFEPSAQRLFSRFGP
jgi:uncharacterized protein (DUF58 family)